MDTIYDMIIVGAGPAGLSAAIYGARAKYKVLVLEKEKIGGQITITHEVVNYPGILETSGEELTQGMLAQAKKFGAQIKISEVLDIIDQGDFKILKTTTGDYKTLGVILAPGANPRKLGFDGEKEYQGRGVAYCATCDGEFFKDKEVYVIGGGFAAVEEGIFLTKYASKVHMIVREEQFTCAKTVYEKITLESKIDVLFETEVESVSGNQTLDKITLKNKEKQWSIHHDDGFGVFVFAGYVPNTSWLPSSIELEQGYIVTDINRKTNIDGIYGAGDVCIKNLRQVVTAVSDGALAATSLEKVVQELHVKLELPDFVQDEITDNKEVVEDVESDSFISNQIRQQLAPVFNKFKSKVIIKGYLNDDKLSNELHGFLDEFESMSEKVMIEREQSKNAHLEIYFEDGTSSGISFYTVPGGHEFNSFIIALYNVAGPGKDISKEDEHKISNIHRSTKIQVFLSLSCTMCPEVVMATGTIASRSKHVNVEAIDIAHYPELKEKYKIMSVPCMVINETEVHFGKKNISQILELL